MFNKEPPYENNISSFRWTVVERVRKLIGQKAFMKTSDDLLELFAVPQFDDSVTFQQDDAPARYGIIIKELLDRTYQWHWIDGGWGHMEAVDSTLSGHDTFGILFLGVCKAYCLHYWYS